MRETEEMYFTNYTGKGVTVAVIDSGVNVYHSHIDQQITGKFFRVNRQKYIEVSSDIRDLLGHGTAITAVIRYMAKDANIVVGKVFDEKLACYPSVVTEAIYWAIEKNVDVINLSLGMKLDDAAIKEACLEAAKQNIAVVAALDEDSGFLYPAKYDEVFTVSATDIEREKWQLERTNFFRACGVPRELHGDVQRYNLHGHSFAAAHFTSWIARFLECYGGGRNSVMTFMERLLNERV